MIGNYVIKGILIGLIFGVSAGAIGALTMEKGFLAGFLTGLGSSAADLLYSAAGIFGIAIISDFLAAYQNLIQAETVQEIKGNLGFCFLSSFGTAIMNPATILSFMAAFTAFEVSGSVSAGEGAGLIFGILFGTLSWWMLLSGGVSLLRKRITGRIYQWLNKILGSFMAVFGMIMVVRGCL